MGDGVLRWFAKCLSPAGARGRLTAFCYHQVLDGADPLRRGEPTALQFEADLNVIDRQFTVLGPLEAVRRLRDGTLPERSACITFDDGYANNREIAVPILLKKGIPAVFFVATGAIEEGIMWNDLVIEALASCGSEVRLDDVPELGWEAGSFQVDSELVSNVLTRIKYRPLSRRMEIARAVFAAKSKHREPRLMMTPTMVTELVSLGFEVGAHTVNHPILSEVTDEQAKDEIVGSLDWLEKLTGDRPVLFAYPNGKPGIDYSERHAEMIERLGFEGAFSTEWSVAKSESQLFQLPRVGPWWRAGRSAGVGQVRAYIRTYL